MVRKFGKFGNMGVSLSTGAKSAGYLLPLVSGAAIGWLCAALIGYFILSKSSELQVNFAQNVQASQEGVQAQDGLLDFIFANPFSITPMPSAEKPKDNEEEIVVTGSLASALLTGTFPTLGAWVEDKDNKKTVFLSIGESFDVYKLDTVLYDRATFMGADGNVVTKFLYLKPDAVAETKPSPRNTRNTPQTQGGDLASQVTAAEPGGKEGVVARDVVNQLLMNPFDEMKKFRLRPKFDGDVSIGIEVQWIDESSILGSLGVIQDDVIKSVNGIPIKNMGDVANAINSLMNGSRFDVEVLRGETLAPTSLTYVVK